ncbi:hypothetical protein SK128_017494 [Halocaridina rubra]|uniref:Uncharacterized protein n=1 Tax=Halocaridina rubra TaxID=373956 RepID=A0AAN8WMY5_HALRR
MSRGTASISKYARGVKKLPKCRRGPATLLEAPSGAAKAPKRNITTIRFSAKPCFPNITYMNATCVASIQA